MRLQAEVIEKVPVVQVDIVLSVVVIVVVAVDVDVVGVVVVAVMQDVVTRMIRVETPAFQ